MDTAHCWPQGIGIGVVKSMGAAEAEQGNNNSDQPRPILERRGRPPKDQALNCPRCNSTTTKFCYYNNYSLSQPRYFCKSCRRYWTEGGSLRNVPVGGGSRKNNKRSTYSSSSPPSTSDASKKANNNILPNPQSSSDIINSQNPKIHHGQDLNLSYPPTSTSDHQNYDNHPHHQSIFNPSSSAIGTSSPRNLSAIELLESTGINATRGLMNSFMVPDSINGNIVMFSGGHHHHGFPTIQEFKPSLGFSLDGFDGGNYLQGVQETSHHHQAKLLFPVDQDSKPIPITTAHPATTATQSAVQFERNRGEGDQSGGFWNGMSGGGSW